MDADEDKNQRSEESSGMIIARIVVIYVGVLLAWSVGIYVASFHLKKSKSTSTSFCVVCNNVNFTPHLHVERNNTISMSYHTKYQDNKCWSELALPKPNQLRPGNLGPDRSLFCFGGESLLQQLGYV